MARGTFKRIVAALRASLSDVRRAFGRTAARIAKRLLENRLGTIVTDPNQRSALLSKPGPLWLVAVRRVYKTFADIMKDKLARGELRITPEGYFNITEDEVASRVAADLDNDLRNTLRTELKIPV